MLGFSPGAIASGAVLLLAFWMGTDRALADDQVVRAPADYGTFAPPALGSSYTDTTFGVKIKRASDARQTSNRAGSGPLDFVSTDYPGVSPFNSDQTRLILLHQSYYGLYDGAGAYLEDLPLEVHSAAEPRWSRSEPDLLYFLTGNRLMKLSVSTGVASVVRSFPEYAAIRGRGESDISPDGDHFVFAADEPAVAAHAGVANRYVFVYEIGTNAKGAVLDTVGHAFNNLHLASDNRVTIGWIAKGADRYEGVELFDRNMTFVRQLTHALGHADITRDTNGEDVLLWTNSDDAAPIPDCQNGIVKVRLDDAHQTCLLELDWSLAVHISAPDGNGWFFVETYAPSDPLPATPAWKLYTNEILQLHLDGTEVRRLFHHRSRGTENYGFQPRAVVSRDGAKLVFTSNYGLEGTPGYSLDYTDVYFVDVPALPPPHISIDDPTVDEGQAGRSELLFTLTLSSPSDLPVSVDFATADGRARAPDDYDAVGLTTLMFAPGETSRIVAVSVAGDTTPESTEVLLANLTRAENSILDDAVGIGRIVNDDLLGGSGLNATYYSNLNLWGRGRERIDPQVNFDPFSGGLRFDDNETGQISVRWTGRVEAPVTDVVTFCTRTNKGVRLYLDGELLIDRWVDQPTTEWCESRPLVAGRQYRLIMEYYGDLATAVAQLSWGSATRTVIGRESLYPARIVALRRTERSEDPPPIVPPIVPPPVGSPSAEPIPSVAPEPAAEIPGPAMRPGESIPRESGAVAVVDPPGFAPQALERQAPKMNRRPLLEPPVYRCVSFRSLSE